MMQQIGAQGWRKKEPVDVPVERPRALRQMAELLYGKPINYAKLAADACLASALVRQIVELHAGAGPDASPTNRARVVPFSRLAPA